MARDLTERGNVQASQPGSNLSNTRFAERLRNAITGEVMFDLYARGRYATDASIYQMMPAAVVIPRSTDEMASALAIAREEGVAVTPRGGRHVAERAGDQCLHGHGYDATPQSRDRSGYRKSVCLGRTRCRAG